MKRCPFSLCKKMINPNCNNVVMFCVFVIVATHSYMCLTWCLIVIHRCIGNNVTFWVAVSVHLMVSTNQLRFGSLESRLIQSSSWSIFWNGAMAWTTVLFPSKKYFPLILKMSDKMFSLPLTFHSRIQTVPLPLTFWPSYSPVIISTLYL